MKEFIKVRYLTRDRRISSALVLFLATRYIHRVYVRHDCIEYREEEVLSMEMEGKKELAERYYNVKSTDQRGNSSVLFWREIIVIETLIDGEDIMYQFGQGKYKNVRDAEKDIRALVEGRIWE